MAVDNTMVWEVRSTATAGNVNGGGFKPGATGVDYSQQDAAQYALTGLTSAGAGAVILSAAAADDMVGNIIHVISGTNFTAGWYEIISVVVGVSITVDRNVTGGIGSNGVANIGGALANFATWGALTAVLTQGNTIYVKGTLAVLSAGLTMANGAVTGLITINGYNTVRGDNPTGDDRPLVQCGNIALNFGQRYVVRNCRFTGAFTSTVVCPIGTQMFNCKVINSSVTANRPAILANGVSTQIVDCEAISYRGPAVSTTAVGILVDSCYLHDSNFGISCTASGNDFSNNIISSNAGGAFTFSAASTSCSMVNNTMWGGQSSITGIGVTFASGAVDHIIMNSIIYGFVTGVSDGNAGPTFNYLDYNDFFNNTANLSGVNGGPHDLVVNPLFTNAAQITGATATTSGSVLTQAGANFSLVQDNIDYCYIVSGTGITAGQYLITSHTADTLTLDIAPGNSAVADKVFQVSIGHNYAIGHTAVANSGSPEVFQGGFTTSYTTMGAVQNNSNVQSGGAFAYVGG
jgi:hypothetical protein